MKFPVRFALAFFTCQCVLHANSILADPEKKDLCGVWISLTEDIPVVLDLGLTGPSYCTTLAVDGTPITYTFSWTTFSRRLDFRYAEAVDEASPPMTLDTSLSAASGSWSQINLTLTGTAIAGGKRTVELKLVKAGKNLRAVLQALEHAKKKQANQTPEPTPMFVTPPAVQDPRRP